MNVLEDVGNHVVDAIKNVIISVVWLNARRDVGIFVWIVSMTAIQNVYTRNATENALKSVLEYHAMNHANKY